MGWFGFGKKTTYVIALSREGPDRLRLNGNHINRAQMKKNAQTHDQTVVWFEVTAGGGRVDQGTGPASSKLAPGALERLQRDVHLSPAFKAIVEELDGGREHASKWYKHSK